MRGVRSYIMASLPRYRGKDAEVVGVNTRKVVLTPEVVKADIAYVMSASALFCHQFDLRALESWR